MVVRSLDEVNKDLDTVEVEKAPLVSPTFTGTVSGVTKTHVGLGNVANESKATMFTDPAFTGTPTIGGSNAVSQATEKSWVLKWSGSSASKSNDWGTGEYKMFYANADVFIKIRVTSSTYASTLSKSEMTTDQAYYIYHDSNVFYGKMLVPSTGAESASTISEIYKWE